MSEQETPNAENKEQPIEKVEMEFLVENLEKATKPKDSPEEISPNLNDLDEIAKKSAEKGVIPLEEEKVPPKVVKKTAAPKQDFGGYRTKWEQEKAEKNKARAEKHQGFPAELMKMTRIAVINEGRALVIRCQKVGINTTALESALASTVKLFD